MRPRRAWTAPLLAALLLSACAHEGPDPRVMRFPAPDFSPPRPARHVLANGLVVFLMEDHEIPLVEGRALVRTGAVLDPPGRTGLARLTGQALVRGGTEALPGEKIDRALEVRAIQMSGEIGSQSGNVSFSALTEQADFALRVFADLLRRPAFDRGRFELARRRAIEEVRRIVDDPDSLAFREFRRHVYDGDPRGRAATIPEVSAISPEDAAAFWRESARPDRVILGFSGDFEPKELLADLERLFGDWPPSGASRPEFPVPDASLSQRSLNLIGKDLDQATIVLGHLAPPRTSDDSVPFMLADYILGGAGFNSRLTREIRSNRGLAYSAGSFYRGDIGYGVFVELVKTKNESAPEVLGLMLGLTEEMRREGVTEGELDWARESIVNSMIFRYGSAGAILAEAMGLEYDGLPPDFVQRVKERVESATPADVSAAAARHMNPGEATVVILGKESDYRGAWPAGKPLRRWSVGPEGTVE